MSWWKKEDNELPEALRGKTAEEIAAALTEVETLKTKNTTMESELASQRSQFETFNNTIEELKQRLPEPQRQQRQPQQDEPTSFLVDGDKAFAERIGPLYSAMLGTNAQLARQEAIRRAQNRQKSKPGNLDGVLFEKFQNEVDELAKGCSPQQLAVPETWEHLYYNVKGRHSDEIVQHNVEGKGDFFVESAQRAPSGNEQNDKAQLTPLEKKIAARMGVSEERYLKQRNGMSVDGVPEELINV